MPTAEWPYAVQMAEFIINRLPCRSIDWKTPYELFFGKRPSFKHLVVPGCKAMVHIDKAKGKGKFKPRSVEKVVVGFNSTGYKVFDPRTKVEYNSCNLKSFEYENYADVAQDLKSLSSDEYLDLQPELNPIEHDSFYAWSYVSKFQETTLSDCVPQTYEEAIESPFVFQWTEAIKAEITSLIENNTWVELNSDTNLPLSDHTLGFHC